jgi:hypothetical protein
MESHGDYYILNTDDELVAVDLLTWARWQEANRLRCQIARDVLPDGTLVSTIFLGLDHGFGLTARPLLFETMVFDASGEITTCHRYATRAEAQDGHHACVGQLLGFVGSGPMGPAGPGPEG